jgi:hypothetical protein
MAKFDDDEIGGKAYEPFGITLRGNQERAKGLIGYGQALLGNLKHRMQLGGLEQGRERKVLPDGSVIQFRSIKGPLADLDKIDIFVPQDAGVERAEGEERIVEFHAYCSAPLSGIDDYNADGYADAASTHWVFYEPFHTSGSWLSIETEGSIGSPIAFAEGGYVHLAGSSPDIFGDYYISQVGEGYNSTDEYAQQYRHYTIARVNHLLSAVSPYRAIVTLENVFRHAWDEKHGDLLNQATQDGTVPKYVGRFSIDTRSGFEEDAALSDYFYEMVEDPIKNDDFFGYYPEFGDTIDALDDRLTIPSAPDFLDGWYILYVGGFEWPRETGFLTPTDQYRALLLFKTNLGRAIAKGFIFDIEYSEDLISAALSDIPNAGDTRLADVPAKKALAINFKLGLIRVYEFNDPSDNPFLLVRNITGDNFGINGLPEDYAETHKNFVTNIIRIF